MPATTYMLMSVTDSDLQPHYIERVKLYPINFNKRPQIRSVSNLIFIVLYYYTILSCFITYESCLYESHIYDSFLHKFYLQILLKSNKINIAI